MLDCLSCSVLFSSFPWCVRVCFVCFLFVFVVCFGVFCVVALCLLMRLLLFVACWATVDGRPGTVVPPVFFFIALHIHSTIRFSVDRLLCWFVVLYVLVR